MAIVHLPLRAVVFALALGALGCHAQTPGTPGANKVAAGSSEGGGGTNSQVLAPDVARRIEVLIRAKSNVPPDYNISFSGRRKSDVPGFDEIDVTFSADTQTSKPTTFLVSEDNRTLAQFSRYDISRDPKQLVASTGRPARGGPADAPVVIVGFDDLECPFCAKMHAQLFPALTARYKDQVRIVYRDFPLDQHPWAMRAAVDTNCLATQSQTGYWNVVDHVHAHASELGGTEHSLAKANDELDGLVRDEGKRQKVKADLLDACIQKQDASAINASRKEAETLGVDSTPALFINGERVEGAIPIEYIYRMVDSALTAAGFTPPPPVPVPPMPGAVKSGS